MSGSISTYKVPESWSGTMDPVNRKLINLWDNIADAIRNQNGSSDQITPLDYPDLIKGIDTVSAGEYPIYVTGPVGTTVTARRIKVPISTASEGISTYKVPASGSGNDTTTEDEEEDTSTGGGGTNTAVIDSSGSCVIWVTKAGWYSITGVTASGTSTTSATVYLYGEIDISIDIPCLGPSDLNSLVSPLPILHAEGFGISSENYAVIAGGCDYRCSDIYNARVDVYDKDLTHSEWNDMVYGRYRGTAPVMGNKGFLVGGAYLNNQTHIAMIEMIDLDEGVLSSFCSFSRRFWWLGSGANETLAVIAGGFSSYESTGWNYSFYIMNDGSTSVDYNYSNTIRPWGTSDENGVLIGGGNVNNGGHTPFAYHWDNNKTKTRLSNTSHTRTATNAFHLGEYFLIAGGQWDTSTIYDSDVYFCNDLSHSTCTGLSFPSMETCGAKLGDDKIIYTDKCGNHATDIYDTNLSRMSGENTIVLNHYPGTWASIGNYAIFVGGDDDSGQYSDVIDVFSVV